MTFENLKILIGARLDSLTTINIDSKESKLSNSYPNIVFTLSNIDNSTRGRNDYILQLDFWDNKADSTTILTAAEAIKANMDYGFQYEAQGFYHSYLEFYSEIPTGEPDKSHVQQRYLLKVR